MRTLLTLTTLAVLFASCGRGDKGDSADTLRPLPDTLRVATLYSPTGYFIYQEEQMGYDYTLVKDWCEDKHIHMELEVAPALQTALEWLDSGLVDLVAYEVPVTRQYNEFVRHCGPVTVTNQVLVQPRSEKAITDVTQLVGRDVYVEADSKYEQRIRNLDNELGGGINIHTVDRDTLITEDLLEMVAEGQIPLTVVDSDVARLNKTYYPGLDISLSLSFGQKAQWAVAPQNAWLADSIDSWFDAEQPRRIADTVYKIYFERSKLSPGGNVTIDLRKGHISPYDNLFRRYAGQIGWDWRLLASLGYVESRFNPNVTSWAGARGIMQVMPSVARSHGVDPARLVDPETSIRMAVKLIQSLDKTMARYVKDPVERHRFVIAAYNSGGAHIIDAITLARKYGHDPAVWHGNVSEALLLKADPNYYNDPDVRFGYFRGRQTVAFVDQVEEFYHRTQKHIKK